MTNHDEFDQMEEPGAIEQVPRGRMTSNLAEAWRSRPLFKLLVLMTVVGAIIAAGIGVFSGSTSSSSPSRVAKPPEMTEAPGGKSSPFFIEQTKEAAEHRAATALQTGGSAMPTPVGAVVDTEEMGGEGQKKDPLVELRAETEHVKQQLAQMQQQQQVQQQVQQPKPQAQQFDDSLAQAMQRQMQQLMESWTPRGVKTVDVSITQDKERKNAADAAAAAAGGANGAGGAAASVPPPSAKTLVPAGTVSYAQLLIEANSDVPGTIMAQILSGPLSGARAIGQFQVQNDYLVMQFTLVNFKGKDYGINALALDPDTTLGGMATEVDQRYFSRVLLPAGASFLQSFGSTIGQGGSDVTENGTTTIVSQSSRGIRQGVFSGIGQAAQTASQFFQNQANQIKPLVRVAAGTPMGLFFVTSVADTTLQPGTYPGSYPGGAGYPVAYGAGSPAAGGYQQGQGTYPAAGYPSSPYGSLPGATFGGYGVNPNYAGGNNSAPYPNYANPAGASPGGYSVLPGSAGVLGGLPYNVGNPGFGR